MNNDNFKTRQQYIRNGLELSHKTDVNLFIKGNEKKVELDKKLEELSYQTGIQASSAVARENLMGNVESTATSTPLVVDTLIGESAKARELKEAMEEENPVHVSPKEENFLPNLFNKGKEIMDAIRNKDS